SHSVKVFQQTLRGTVTDEQGNPLPGVSVVVKGTTTGTSTDQEGRYEIELPSASSVLVFSIIGYTPQEIPAQGDTELSVVLKEQLGDLEEVVVVGYGTQLKRDLTGAISKVEGSDLKNMPIRNAVEGLQGQSAGVQVTSTGGSPGTPPAVRIRGIGTVNDNNPLYVVDGL